MREDNPPHGQPERWFALALLTAIYTVHSMDRMVLSIVIEPLKHEFGLDDRQIGILGGLAHGLGYGLTVIPLGMLFDRGNRVRLLSVLVMLWSGLTLMIGFAGSYAAALLCRFGVGAAEGGGASGCLSLLSDYFDRSQRATAIGIFYMSTGLGVAIIFSIGGFLADHVGWRGVFLLAGLPGLVLGLVALLRLREPQRTSDTVGVAVSEMEVLPLGRALRRIVAIRQLWLSILGLTIALTVSTGFWTWAAAFLIRVHHLSTSEAGLVLAVALGLVQTLGMPIAGRLNDHLSRGRPDRVHLVSVFALALTIPVALFTVLVPTPALAITGLMALALCAAGWLGQSLGALAILAPAGMRGTVVGVGQLGVNLIGMGCGPALVGALSDGFGGSLGLRYALAAIALFWLCAIPCFLAAMAAIRAETRAAPATQSRFQQS